MNYLTALLRQKTIPESYGFLAIIYSDDRRKWHGLFIFLLYYPLEENYRLRHVVRG